MYFSPESCCITQLLARTAEEIYLPMVDGQNYGYGYGYAEETGMSKAPFSSASGSLLLRPPMRLPERLASSGPLSLRAAKRKQLLYNRFYRSAATLEDCLW